MGQQLSRTPAVAWNRLCGRGLWREKELEKLENFLVWDGAWEEAREWQEVSLSMHLKHRMRTM